jgi:hypothetical protein
MHELCRRKDTLHRHNLSQVAAADVQEVGRSGSLPLTSPPKEG